MVTLYSTHCPRCIVIEKKLQQKGIEYQEVNDMDEMESLGIMSVPMLKVGDKMYSFVEANAWINEQED